MQPKPVQELYCKASGASLDWAKVTHPERLIVFAAHPAPPRKDSKLGRNTVCVSVVVHQPRRMFQIGFVPAARPVHFLNWIADRSSG
jgi:hypothetical protein